MLEFPVRIEMSNNVSRRTALQLAMGVVAAPLVLQNCFAQSDGSSKQTQPSPMPGGEGAGLTSYLNSGQVAIRWNNVVVAVYRANSIQKFPYFSPLAGPLTGLPLTTETSLPFPHHRGLWLGCEPLNGGDYWKDSPLDLGQIRSLDLQIGEMTPTSVGINNRCQWTRRGEASPLLDERKITFRVSGDHLRLLDFDVRLTALNDIRIKKAKHSFFALRVAPDLAPLGGGRLENCSGQIGESETFGKPSKWCGYYGRRASHPAGDVEGIALMNHPENPWNPCPWLARDYGHLSPSPFNFLERPWELKEGATIRLRYRVAMHAGTPQEAGLDQIYKDWLAT
jgi:hypothetical protein